MQYTDERPTIIIPGGPKIKSHLQNNRFMGVVKHDGKMRMNPKPKEEIIIEDSFADLSVASGDISFYTLKK